MFRAPVLVVHTCLGWAWLGLESQSYTLLMWVQQISYDVPLPSNTSSGKCCHTLAWLDSTGFGKFAWAWLGLASARLYYTAPYRFLVSMFRAPVLFNTHLLGLGWAWVGLSPDDKFDKLNSGRGSAWLGLAWGFIARHRTDFWYRCFVHLSSYTDLDWAWVNCLLPINSTN